MWSLITITVITCAVYASAYRRRYPGDPLEDIGPDGTDYRTDYENNGDLVVIYNKNNEKCCAGTTFQLELGSDRNQRCCGSVLYETKTQGCCGNNAIYELDSDDGCCDGKAYSKSESLCCISRIGREVIVKLPPEIVDNSTSVKNTACCGLKLYDTELQKCCEKRSPKSLGQLIRYFGLRIRYYQHTIHGLSLNTEDNMNENAENTYFRFYREVTAIATSKIGNASNDDECEEQLSNGDRLYYRSRFDISEMLQPYENDTFAPGTCNNATFNVNTHICCTVEQATENGVIFESKLHERNSQITLCCGLETFIFTNEICCNNNVLPQNSEFSLLCCGNNTYDYTEEECCETSDTAVPISSLPDSEYSCCGAEKTPFSRRKGFCCGGKIISYDDVNAACCGSQVINLSEELCCMDRAIKKSTDSDWCCGQNKYDTTTQLCCDEGNILAKKSANESCCGNTTYDFKKETCCIHQHETNSEVYETKIHPVPVSNFSSQYDYDDPRLSNDPCCGLQVYNSPYQSCWRGMIYDSRTEICCSVANKEVVVKKTSKNDRCCGEKAFDFESQLCCNGNVVERPVSHLECCGSSVYNRVDDLCCGDTIYSPKDKKRNGCCGDKMIDNFKQVCCRGAVKDVVNPLRAGCCYNSLP